MECFDEKDLEKRRNALQKALAGEAQNYQAVIMHKKGNLISVDITYIPIISMENKVLGLYGIMKDITNFIQDKNELVKMQETIELLQQTGKFGMWNYDFQSKEWFWSKQKYKLYGLMSEDGEIPLKKIKKMLHPEDRDYVIKHYLDALKKHSSFQIEFRILHEDGTIIYLAEQGNIFLDKNNTPISFIGITQDISQRKKAEQKLAENKELYKNILDNLEVGIWPLDIRSNRFLLKSPGLKRVFGYSPEELIDLDFLQSIIYPEDLLIFLQHQKELVKNGVGLALFYRVLHKSGELIWVKDQTIPVFDNEGTLIRLDGIFTDITDIKKSEKIIKHLAYHDYLTDMPNKRMFDEKLQILIERSKAQNETFSILNMDIDSFKNINNALGHDIADQLLKDFAERIKGIFPITSLFSRLGSDEFSVLLWDLPKSEKYAMEVAAKIMELLQIPFIINGYEVYMTVSVGISTYPRNGKTSVELQKSANIALFHAKENGKNTVQIYSSSFNIQSYKLFTLERDLRKAIKNNEFEIYFQPRVDIQSRRMVRAEALIRWHHPDWGIVSPKEFIPIAEEDGLIIEIGDWVLKQVCLYIKEWEEAGLSLIPISINASPRRFLRNDWKNVVFDVLKETNVDPTLLEFEITETTFLHHNKIIRSSVGFLGTIGIKVALDDFGTGYSSLSHLESYPIDTIKIDKSFIDKIGNNRAETIIKASIFLAKGLQLNVVAEGVETIKQIDFLKQLDCDEIQGYLFSKPVPEREFQQLLKKQFLKPVESPCIKKGFVERRRYYRIGLVFPLRAQMALISINNRRVELGKTEVLVKNIGLGGLMFLSTLELPVRPDFVLQFETTILNEKLILVGNIVWKREEKDLFHYGVQFTMDEKETDLVAKVLNSFSVQLRKNPLLPNCDFVQEEERVYLKSLSR